MADNILTILENHRAHLLKTMAMMSTGTMSIRIEGRDATSETYQEYDQLVRELDAAIQRHGSRNA